MKTFTGNRPLWPSLVRKDDGPTPSTGEALPGGTIMDPAGHKKKAKPKANSPVGTNCNYCGGTDGYHEAWCPRNISDPALGMQAKGV